MMKSFLTTLFAVLLFVLGSQSAVGATRDMTVAFPKEGRPGVLKIVSGEGDVTVTGYDGKDVVITAEGSSENIMEENEKAKGLKRISGTRFNVSTDEDENAVIIARPMSDEVDLHIKVPKNTFLIIGGPVDRASTGAAGGSNMVKTIESIVAQSLQIALNAQVGGIFNGNVNVKNIAGQMEISTLDGAVTLTDVSGPAVVTSMDGTVTAVFSGTGGSKPMAFSTIDGDVDVTLPPNTKATIIASNIDGDVYTDFDIDLVPEVRKNSSVKSATPAVPPVADVAGSNMGLMGMPGSSITGEINGGGMEIMMQTIDGDIFIRKGK